MLIINLFGIDNLNLNENISSVIPILIKFELVKLMNIAKYGGSGAYNTPSHELEVYMFIIFKVSDS